MLLKLVKAALGMAIAVVATLLLTDIVAFQFAPTRYVDQFPSYRVSANPRGFAGRGTYPHNYFVANAELGFDIGRNMKAEHWVEGDTYPIWSNSLGCFDTEPDLTNGYIYLVGDSYTWGYAPFEDKFGVLLEESLGRTVLKCGVTHSGQRHQLLKLREIQAEIHRAPDVMLVYWYLNDIANDHYFPHSTVIDGWQVDNKKIDAQGNTVVISNDVLVERVRERVNRKPDPIPWHMRSSRNFLFNYSLTFNLAKWAWDKVRHKPSQLEVQMATSAPADADSIYDVQIEKDGRLWYTDNPIAAENKQALLDLQAHANTAGAGLGVVLIPPPEHVTDRGWHSEVRAFLEAQDLRYVDLTVPFSERGVNADTVFLLDGHFNIYGNRLVAEITASEFADLLSTSSSSGS